MGAQLGALISGAIDEMVTEETPRADIVAVVAEAGGIEAETLNQIINGDIDCPPLDRLAGFATELDGVTAAALEEAGLADGCPFGETEDDTEETD